MAMNVFDLQAVLKLDKSNYEDGLKAAGVSAKSIGNSIVTGFKTVAKVGAAAITAAAGAVTMITKEAVSAYASYEQLTGGIETLFGAGGKSLEEYAASVGKSTSEAKAEYQSLMDAQSSMLQNAQNAWKTAGMSANDYMATAIDSSAALIASLGGDTKKAATYADMAISDMADNANKMGTDLESLQNAYKGFSRENYTMLDNLALGFSGTKQGMQELIDKANEINAAHGKMSEYSIESYADIIEAIHTVQEEMGITGTTAEEAMTTIEGSANATKAAWQNVLTAIAGGGDLKQAMENLSTAVFGDGSAGTGLLANVIPRIQAALEGIGEFIASAAPIIAKRLPELVTAILPSLLSSAVSLIASLVAAIPGLMQALWTTAQTVVQQGLETLSNLFSDGTGDILTDLLNKSGEFLDVALEWVSSMVSGFAQGLPDLLANVLPMLLQISEKARENAGKMFDAGLEMLLQLAQGIADSLPTLIAYIPQIISNIVNIINDNFPKILKTGVQIIITLVKGLIQAIPSIIENLGNIVKMMIDVFMAINWLDLGVKILTFIGNGIKSLASTLPQKLMDIGNDMWNKLASVDWANLGSTVINFITNGIQNLFSSIPSLLKTIGETAFNFLKSVDWSLLGKTVINFILSGIQSLFSMVPNLLKSIGSSAVSFFSSIDWLGLGKKVVNFIVNGIKSLLTSIPNTLKNIAVSGMNAITSINWRSIGTNIVNGIVGGIKSVGSTIKNTLMNLAKSAWNSVCNFLGINSPSRLFRDTVGKNISKGIAVGVEENDPTKDIVGTVSGVFDGVKNAIDSSSFDIPVNVVGSQEASGFDNIMDRNIQKIIDVCTEYFPQFAQSKVVLDTGTMVGEMLPAIDEQMGELLVLNGGRL